VSRLQLALQGLGRLLNGLFDLSGLESGTVAVANRPVEVAALLAELQSAFAGPAAAKGLGFEVVLPHGLWLDTDPVILARVLSNLVANALRYTSQGRILVGCRRRAHAQVELQVLDTGIGIPPEEQAHIFGEFYQVANVARERERGMGLGLAIAQRSAQLLGATIDVRSIPRRGSVFSVTLPLAAASAPAPAAADDTAPQPPAQLRGPVLVIDDDPQLTQAMQKLLIEWGHEALTADSVTTAVAAAARAGRHGAIGFILADYQLAGERSGIDAIRAVAQQMGEDIPAIIVTGDTSTRAAVQAKLHGYPVLHKPVDPDLLRGLIEKAAARAR
jgi:CheY-like chemotaxis protein/anti-sigma regulatory factor (Ser/Thr protein kinase)